MGSTRLAITKFVWLLLGGSFAPFECRKTDVPHFAPQFLAPDTATGPHPGATSSDPADANAPSIQTIVGGGEPPQRIFVVRVPGFAPLEIPDVVSSPTEVDHLHATVASADHSSPAAAAQQRTTTAGGAPMTRNALRIVINTELMKMSKKHAILFRSSKAVWNGYLLWDKAPPPQTTTNGEPRWWNTDSLGSEPRIDVFFQDSSDWKNTPVTAFAILSFLLLIGKALRIVIKPLRTLHLPSSVIGGIFGYCVVLVLKHVGQEGCVPDDFANQWAANGHGKWGCKEGVTKPYSFVSTYYLAGWDKLPEVLIGVIFAAVFIGVEVPPCKAIWEGSGPQIMYGQVVTHGLWFFGLGSGLAFAGIFQHFKSSEEEQWLALNPVWADPSSGTKIAITRENMYADKFVGRAGTIALTTGTQFWTGNQLYRYGDNGPVYEDSVAADLLPPCYGTAMYLGFEGGHASLAG